MLLEFAHFCIPKFHLKSKAGMKLLSLLHWEFSKRCFLQLETKSSLDIFSASASVIKSVDKCSTLIAVKDIDSPLGGEKIGIASCVRASS